MRKAVYNTRYYKIKTLLKDKDFQSDIAWLKNEFARFGVPVPDTGFKTYKEYLAWNDQFWKMFAKYEYSDEVKALWNSLAAEDGKIYGSEKMVLYEDEKAKIVPPVYGAYLEGVARKHGLDHKDKAITEFLIDHVFFGKDEITDTPFEVVHERNKKTDEFEMYIRIYPWTTKEDVVKGWDFINEEQGRYPDKIERNQYWKNFDRDYEIYELYERAREIRASGDPRRLELITYSLYHDLHPDDEVDLDNIKRINSMTRKRLGFSDTISDDTA